jgi:uncharacterized protein YacL
MEELIEMVLKHSALLKEMSKCKIFDFDYGEITALESKMHKLARKLKKEMKTNDRK